MKVSTCLTVLAVALCFVDVSESFGLITGTITISAGTLALVGGVAVLKAVAVKALALGAAAGAASRNNRGGRGGRGGRGRGSGGLFGFRGKREIGDALDAVEIEEEATFAMLAKNEPEQCYQRLICDLATGKMPESDNDIIPTLFRNGASEQSAKFNYFLAAQLGKTTQDIKKCEVTFTCTVSLQTLYE